MDFPTFRRAVDSLDGFVGTVGIMGGEPTLHPDFPRLVKYAASRRVPKQGSRFIRPLDGSFMDATRDSSLYNTISVPQGGGKRDAVNGIGLWSSIGEKYKQYYEVIQDHVHHQVLNDHLGKIYHQPALVTRRELKIPDEEWILLRDACWVQNNWSASVTPKGAFFCEIAAALDMLFEGPGGWKIEPGWWQRTPAQFGDQLRWCEMCGFALKTFMRDANDEIDDVSPVMYEKLQRLGSPKIGTSHVKIMKLDALGQISDENIHRGKRFSDGMPYAESYNAKFNEKETNLKTKNIIGVFKVHGDDDLSFVSDNLRFFPSAYILSENQVYARIKEMAPGCDSLFWDGRSKTLGNLLYAIDQSHDYNTYVLVVDGMVCISAKLIEDLNRFILNPGTLLFSAPMVSDDSYFIRVGKNHGVALLNTTAESVRTAGWDNVLSCTCLKDLRALWQSKKCVPLRLGMERVPPSAQILQDKRYAVYGAGDRSKRALAEIKKHGARLAMVIDGDPQKQGMDFGNHTVRDLTYLCAHKDEIDFVLISSMIYYAAIKDALLRVGFAERDITLLN